MFFSSLLKKSVCCICEKTFFDFTMKNVEHLAFCKTDFLLLKKNKWDLAYQCTASNENTGPAEIIYQYKCLLQDKNVPCYIAYSYEIIDESIHTQFKLMVPAGLLNKALNMLK